MRNVIGRKGASPVPEASKVFRVKGIDTELMLRMKAMASKLLNYSFTFLSP